MAGTIEFGITEIHRLRPDPRNARTHSKKQIEQIAESITAHGFVNPVLNNPTGLVIAGHGRLRAARQLGLTKVPTITISGLSEAEERRLRVADNKIALNAGWDPDLLKVELAEIELSGLDLSVTGFSIGEIDVMREMKLEGEAPFDPVPRDPVTQLGDIWVCGVHRICCGDTLDGTSLDALMAGERADMIMADPPYNTSNATHNGGSGKIRHAEFAYAHGEMSRRQFIDFLANTQGAMASRCKRGAVAFIFMDHHHAGEQIEAGETAFARRLNIAIWVKSNAGMGSLYRSQHEMIFIYVVGEDAHQNNIELGKHGRNRTNVWNYSSVNTFGARQADLELHPTVKPTKLVSDAIMDVTARGDIVLDGFLGSGTTLLAAVQTHRRAFGLEIDPAYVDVALNRWINLTAGVPVLESTGETFADVATRRAAETTVDASETENVG